MMLFYRYYQRWIAAVVLSAVWVLLGGLTAGPCSAASVDEPNDLHFTGMLAISADIPRIYALARRSEGGDPLTDPEYGYFAMEYFFDTGASGILMTRTTRDQLGIQADPNSVFWDVGVGGKDSFAVSELLYFSLADYSCEDPFDAGNYRHDYPGWRCQLLDEDGSLAGIDGIMGVPVMAGKTVVITPSNLDLANLRYCGADLKARNDPSIPAVDLEIKLRYTDFLYTSDPCNQGASPVLGYNPVIEDITVSYGGLASTGEFLFDTGAQTNIISYATAEAIGLVDPNGTFLVQPAEWMTIGGVGGQTDVPMFWLDSLAVPTLQGYRLVYDQVAAILVDIGIKDETTGDFIILDGIFSMSLIDSTMNTNLDMVEGPVDHAVIDTQRGILGYDLKDYLLAYLPTAVPTCGADSEWGLTDVTHDCVVDVGDLWYLADEWLSDRCGGLDWQCAQADVNRDGRVDLADVALVGEDWLLDTRP